VLDHRKNILEKLYVPGPPAEVLTIES
jgi:hypothetical protein